MIKFFYNIDNNKLSLFDNCNHAIYYHNKKMSKPFDYYIRGIINNNTLYLRLYYPFEDINDIEYKEIESKSLKLLQYYVVNIIKTLKKEGIIIKNTRLNVSNEELKELLEINYV